MLQYGYNFIRHLKEVAIGLITERFLVRILQL